MYFLTWSITDRTTPGVPALTSRSLGESDFEKVVEFLDKGVQIALEAQEATG